MSSILKAANVFIDLDNAVHIKGAVIKPTLPEVIEPVEEPSKLAEDIVQRAKEEADCIVKQADIESKNLIANAKQEVDSIITEIKAINEKEALIMYEKSRQNGHQEGIEQAVAEANAIKAEAQNHLDETMRKMEEMRLSLEPDAVNLIINIVEKLLGDAVNLNPAVVVSLIRRGFAEADVSGQVTVRVSDVDYLEVVARKEDLMAEAGGLVEIEIVRDLSLSSTDCVIDTSFGGIDVSLKPQFEAIRENLIFLLGRPK